MSLRQATVAIIETFFVFDSTGAPVTGLVNSDFSKQAYKDGSTIGTAITIAEIGGGAYEMTMTPTLTGQYVARWSNATYNPRGWKSDYQVTTDGYLTMAELLAMALATRPKDMRGGRVVPASGNHGFIVGVFDSSGNPVTGLTSADFALKYIRDDGGPFIIAFSLSPISAIPGYYVLISDMAALVTAGGVANYVAKITQASNSMEWNFEFDIVGNTPSAPTVTQIRTEMDTNSTKLAHLDDNISAVPGLTWEELRASHVTSGSMGEATQDHFQALVLLLVDKTGLADRYTVAFFKNGALVTAGISAVTIEVIKAADGTDLIASTSMTAIGATGQYRYTETVNRVTKGAAYSAKVGATIGGVGMSWTRPVGRDS